MKKFGKITPVVMPILLPLDIQMLAGDPPAGDPPPTDPPTDPPADPPKKIEFTAEQQEELNRILGEKLAKERLKFEKDLNDKLEFAKTEAQKLANMNAEQKAEHERQQREADIAKRESDITRRELRAEALETLAEKGLPKALADILVFTDADSTKASLEAVDKSFRAAVEEKVNERLKGTPPGGGGSGTTPPTSVGANFAKSLNEQSKPTETTLWK